jgi:UTP--glucose-1-phosphate uridylyltransferase
MIKKAIIPAAGLGTRLLPATKEQPKEMLPILASNSNGKICLKPFLQLVFEQLYDQGFREICFVVGREKRSIEDHFTVDEDFIDYLRSRNKTEYSNTLSDFYGKLRNSTVVFCNQPQPLGFADAVYRARSFSGDEDFLVHAGDDLVLSKRNLLRRLLSVSTDHKADAAFFVQKVKDARKYGVIVGDEIEKGIYRVKQIIEKPSKPPSELAVIAIYYFTPRIYRAIELVKPGLNNEIQLTDAIQILVSQNRPVFALELGAQDKRMEIGDPASYKEAFSAKIGSAWG